jgi:nonribosomal peptide synthetase DhbF
MDSQVKLRGLRIELEEIETVTASHPDVSHAAVMLREDVPGDKRIVAYVVERNGHAPSDDELRRHLLEMLPPYMLPSVFVRLPAIPLAPSGKVDRNALPAPPSDAARRDGDRPAPATPTERTIAETFQDILGVQGVSAGDGFFELGGNSLMALRVVQALRDRLGIEVTVRHLYTASTVANLAQVLDADQRVSV